MAGCPSITPLRQGMQTLCRPCWRRAATWRSRQRMATRRCTRQPLQGTWRRCSCSRRAARYACCLLLELPLSLLTSPPTNLPGRNVSCRQPTCTGLSFFSNFPPCPALLLLQLDQRNSAGSTPLYNASSQGHLAVMRELAEEGATGKRRLPSWPTDASRQPTSLSQCRFRLLHGAKPCVVANNAL